MTETTETTTKKRHWPWIVAGVLGVIVLLVVSMAATLSPDVDSGQPLPEVQLTYLGGGGTFDMAGLRGKLVLLDFWSST